MSVVVTYQPTLMTLRSGFNPTGWLAQDVPAFLLRNGCPRAAAHVATVAMTARKLAERFGVDSIAAEAGGWLHDVSAVWPDDQRLAACEALRVEVLEGERAWPKIVHQKLSVVLAREVFQVRDVGVLSAIGCHTTLKAGASALDKVVFIADKLAWDEPYDAPWHPELREALERSLDDGCRVYLRSLWEQRETLKVFHPWTEAACREMGVP
ncbi:HD domain-containing protein [bacterium]|nr:HD domain-containing protein [bacterium]